jgi:hypothetical protein
MEVDEIDDGLTPIQEQAEEAFSSSSDDAGASDFEQAPPTVLVSDEEEEEDEGGEDVITEPTAPEPVPAPAPTAGRGRGRGRGNSNAAGGARGGGRGRARGAATAATGVQQPAAPRPNTRWDWREVNKDTDESAHEPPVYDPDNLPLHGPTFNLTADELKDPRNIFNKLFPEALRQGIANQTNLYAQQQVAVGLLPPLQRDGSGTWCSYTLADINKYVAALILMGVRGGGSDRLAYSHREAFFFPALHQLELSGRSYFKLKKVLHFNDNSSASAKDDKCHKFRPLLVTADLFNEHYHHGSHLSIDEAVCPFQGHHSGVQRMGKFKRIGDGFRCVWFAGIPS